MSVLRVFLLALLLLLVTCISSSARAEAGSANDEAVRLGHEGLLLYEAAQWRPALEKFEGANRFAFSPVFVLYMARCQRNLGRLLEALRLLEELLRHELEANAPTAWINAVRDARAERGSIRSRIPSVRLVGVELARAAIDGRPAPINQPIDLNPGEHMIRGWSNEGQLILRRITLAEGQQGTVVKLALEPATAARQAPVAATEIATSPATPYRRAAWISSGTAVVAALVGSVTGVMAYDRARAVRGRCDDNQCPRELAKPAEDATDMANLSTTAFGVAGVNAAISVAFFLFSQSL
jgi:hypothetical protein